MHFIEFERQKPFNNTWLNNLLSDNSNKNERVHQYIETLLKPEMIFVNHWSNPLSPPE